MDDSFIHSFIRLLVRSFISLAVITLSTTVQAQYHKVYPVMTLTSGVSIATLGKSVSFPFGVSQYSYAADSSASSAFLGGIFLGAEIPNQSVDIQVGIGYYQTTQFNASGLLTQGVSPATSNTYPYSYQMSSSQFLVETKILTMPQKIYHPYVTAGLGAAINNVYHFQETYPMFLTFTPLYNSNSNTNFTYSIGTGLDVDAGSHVRLGVGYRFTDLGQANLGSGLIDDIPISNRLTQANVFANEVFAQLTIH